jgi:glycosyltransferase involved in cell wall biosynthesis
MLSQFYPPLIGGEERHVRDLSIALAARGHEVAVATLSQRGLPDQEVDGGVQVHRIRGTAQRAAWLFADSDRRHVPPFPDPELSWALQRLVRRLRPEIVHAHNWLVHPFLPLKTWSGARLVLTLHDCSLSCPKKNFMYSSAPCSGPAVAKCLMCATRHYGPAKAVPTVLATWAMGRAEHAMVDMFLPVSRAVAIANELAGTRAPFQVIPNFVPDDVGARDGASEDYLDHLPREDYLLFVGAGRFKGADVLLRAYAGLRDAPPLVIIGAKGSASPTDVPAGVTVLPSWPQAAVMSAWRRSILGVFPSVCVDACPTVVMEAMAMSRPIVASRIGGIPDLVVDGETGLLVPPGDAVALRHAIRRLLGDPELRERMATAAKRRLVEFQASTVVPRVERVYRELLQDRAGGRSRGARGAHG